MSFTTTRMFMVLVSILAPAGLMAESGGEERRIPKPDTWSVEKLKPQPRQGTTWEQKAKRGRVHVPKIVAGLALIGAGTAMIVKAPPAERSRELRGGGTIPCIAISTPLGGGSSSSTTTTCHYEDVKYYDNLYKGGWLTVATGAAVTIWGLVPRNR